MSLSLPLFYFKPTICWVDDDQLLLDAINISFKKYYHCLTFNHPLTFINFFDSYQFPLSSLAFKREFIESDLFGANHHYPVDINIPIIKNIVDIPTKSQEIAVLIVDYNMPMMNGLELCEKIQLPHVKKILLTGEATLDTAIQAFNNGLIDKFICKGHDVSDKLHAYINELSFQYFIEKTAHLISHIEAARPSLFTDSIFVNFFKNWCDENHIEEFYLINKQGNFLVKDKNGQSFYFVACSDYDKAEFLHLNDELLSPEDDLFKQVSNGKLIPFFGVGKESWDIASQDWEHYFHPSQIISGREKYYWAVVNK